MKEKLLVVFAFVFALVLASCQSMPVVAPVVAPVDAAPVVKVAPAMSLEVHPSDGVFYYDGCSPNHKVTIFADVSSSKDIHDVALYIKLFDMEGEGTTPWSDAIQMKQISGDSKAGEFSATLVGNDLKSMKGNFEIMTMYYQVVVFSSVDDRMMSSDVLNDVYFGVCQ